MTRHKNKFWTACLLLLIVVPVVLSGSIWAQGGASDRTGDNPSQKPADVPASSQANDDSYVIGVDDVLAVSVWKEPDISRVVPVRSDGKISLPLAGEIQAASRTPKQLKQELTEKLKNYISDPEVTVIVQEARSRKYNVMGQVARPGSFFLTNSMTVLDALAQAGGFRDFAKKKSIYVLRRKPDGTQERLPFNYKDVIAGNHAEQNIKLQPNDTVVVP